MPRHQFIHWDGSKDTDNKNMHRLPQFCSIFGDFCGVYAGANQGFPKTLGCSLLGEYLDGHERANNASDGVIFSKFTCGGKAYSTSCWRLSVKSLGNSASFGI